MSKINPNDVLPERLEIPYEVGEKVYYTTMYPSQAREYTAREYSVREAVITEISKDYVRLSSFDDELHYSVRPKSKKDICQLVPTNGECYMLMVSTDVRVVAAMLASFTDLEIKSRESQLKRLEDNLKNLRLRYKELMKFYELTEEDVRL